MRFGLGGSVVGTTEEPRLVSGRFLSDFFRVLERQGIPASELLGDLPIPVNERGQVRAPVEWNHFTELMRRLENRVGGPAGLEACGELIGEMAPAPALRGLAGRTASPYALYYAASQWALRRAIPGIDARLSRSDDGQLEIVARLADGLRPCPQIFHFAAGGARVLPRLIGLSDAVVSASVQDHEAQYRIATPPSRSPIARAKRLFSTVFSTGSILHFLEAQQLELHAKNDALQRAHDALAASERRYRAITDAAVDVLCEIDAQGQIVYVSASVVDLIGYTPEQVTNSHYRLWIPRESHAAVTEAFDRLFFLPEGRAVQRVVPLHTEGGRSIEAELTARSYVAPEGGRRIVCILRDMSDRTRLASPHQGIPSNAAPRERLRAHLSLRESSARSTPLLDRSLAQLLARLDELADASQPHSVDALTNATRRLARVVDASLAQADRGLPKFQWVETRKLLRRLQDSVSAEGRAQGLDIQLDVSHAPGEIWTDPELLETALLSLLDWAGEQSGAIAGSWPDGSIRVGAEAFADPEPTDHVVLSVRLPVDCGERARDQAAVDAPFGRLALSIAADAARALGGRIVPGEDEHAPSQRILLTQPPRDALAAD